MNVRLFTIAGIVLAVHLLVIGAFWLGVRRGQSQIPAAHRGDFAVLPEGADLPAPVVDDRATRFEPVVDEPRPATPPRSTGSSGTTQNTRPATPTASSSQMHVVQSGESFWKISKKYGVSVDALMAANDYDKTDTLQVGARLKIPAN